MIKENKYKILLVRILRASLGFFLAGFLIPTVWSFLASHFGLFAGFIAAIVVIGPVWYINHYRALIHLNTGDIGVDMGAGVAVSVFVRDSITHGIFGSFAALPTSFFLILGAVFAGYLAMRIEKWLDKKGDNK